ncbi:hypothetical protein [Criblamydia sequanensis]|uniref:Uncharacterized protein n=1 Tax=Candidatus Criblamydia sequanensis CRIB-18 TaxID=1437425 RepID=A0A090D3C6_9BACT|nr:hypothetical protein [Criblamydia sequanensis]CDR35148.1 hypothetical protein CSEC_2342 [Criblamydia sequanensis CRIB-18]
MNHLEDNQSLVYLARAFDRNDKTNILDEQEIPKSTHVALVVFSRSDTPIQAYAGLGSDGISRLIEPHKKKKFSFITSQNYTLKDLRLRVERNAEKKLGELKVEKTVSQLEESFLSPQDLFRKRKREKEVHEKLEKKENKKSKTKSAHSSEKKRKRDENTNQSEKTSYSKPPKIQKLSSYVNQSSEEPQKISNLSDEKPINDSSPISPIAPNTTAYPQKLLLALRFFDLDTEKAVTRDRPLIPGNRIGLSFMNREDKKIKIYWRVTNSFEGSLKILNQGHIIQNMIDVPAQKNYDLGYFIPHESDGNLITITILAMPIFPGGFLGYQTRIAIPIGAKVGSDLNISSRTIEGGFYDCGSGATILRGDDNNAFFEKTGTDAFEIQGSLDNY